jgi:hypothetical protein
MRITDWGWGFKPLKAAKRGWFFAGSGVGDVNEKGLPGKWQPFYESVGRSVLMGYLKDSKKERTTTKKKERPITPFLQEFRHSWHSQFERDCAKKETRTVSSLHLIFYLQLLLCSFDLHSLHNSPDEGLPLPE